MKIKTDEPSKNGPPQVLQPHVYGTCPWCSQKHGGKCEHSRPVPTVTRPIYFKFKKDYDAQ